MKKPPGPRGRDVLGFFGRGSSLRTLGFLRQTAREYGPISYFRLFHQHTYLIDDAELVKEVLVNQQHRFGRDVGATVLRELVGDGLITREEPLHKERRRVLQPAFHKDQVASFVDLTAGECSEALPRWQDGIAINVGDELRRLTLSIIGASLFGPEFRGNAEAISAILGRVMSRARGVAPLVTFLKPLTRVYRRVLPNGPSLFFQSERTELDRILQPLIEGKQNRGGRDVLSLLLAQYENESRLLTDSDIRNEIVTFVLAGHETTATALTWACYLLARRPEIQEKLAAEAASVLADRQPTSEDLPQLAYASMVFNETLRLFPPVPFFGRRAVEPVDLAGYTIPRGATVLLSPYITQRNERYFEDSESFLPDRWRTAGQPKFAFFPFGGGAKICIGEPFARTEGTLILTEIMRRFELAPDLPGEVGMNPRVTLAPARPVIVVPQLRSHLSVEASA